MGLCGPQKPSIDVALLAEGVDRNDVIQLERFGCLVALLAEGVDRNRPESE